MKRDENKFIEWQADKWWLFPIIVGVLLCLFGLWLYFCFPKIAEDIYDNSFKEACSNPHCNHKAHVTNSIKIDSLNHLIQIIDKTESEKYEKTGPIGDTFAGTIGPIVGLIAAYLTFLAFWMQYLANEQQRNDIKIERFENKFYEMIQLHRANIEELSYTKFDNGEFRTSENRKVFRVIAREFITCLHEIKRFKKVYPELEIFNPIYKEKLETILLNNKCKAKADEVAMIDFAFCFIYFGLSKESETVFLNLFFNRYNKAFANRLKKFLQLKPKEERPVEYSNWNAFINLNRNQIRVIFEEIYHHNLDTPSLHLSVEAQALICNYSKYKYYGGHQHRLGHYFRHLFQSYSFLSSQKSLDKEKKYFYGKTFRSQLSTYEQFLLFANSLSSLGMNWEYTAETDDNFISSKGNIDDFKFITRYHLIKNLPGSKYYDLTYRKFYPNVNFEYRGDISYKK